MNNPYKRIYLDNASEFWERVTSLCRERGVRLNSISTELGYNERTLMVKKTTRSLPDKDRIDRMAQILGVTPEYLINGDGAAAGDGGKFFVPVLNQKLSAGRGQPLPGEEEITGYMELPPSLRQYGRNLAVLHVEGDSMEPTLSRGDMVACDTLGYDGEGIYAIRRDGDGYVKRIERDAKNWLIISDNKHYPVKTEPVTSESLVIVGRVRCVVRFI